MPAKCRDCSGDEFTDGGACVQCRAFPTLGYEVWDYIEDRCVIPDGEHRGAPYVLTDEMARFVLAFYRVHPDTGQWVSMRGAQLVRAQKWGKALALDTPLPTPDGWTTMGDVQPGDVVFDERGDRCMVVAKSPVWAATDCYRVAFSDGERVVASGDHLWAVQDRQAGYATTVLDTRTLARLGPTDWGGDARRWRMPMAGPLDCDHADLPIDPYTLGAWLGDGERNSGRIAGIDPGVFAEVAAAGYEVRQTPSRPMGRSVIGLMAELRDVGVLNHKFIPDEYLRGSRDQRIALLQGLMDTDGYAERHRCEFTTTTTALRDGMADLLASLGFKYAIGEHRATLDGRDIGPKWRIRFAAHDHRPVFRLDRKVRRQACQPTRRARSTARHITAITPVASVPTQCVTVDSPSSLFLAGRRMVPTHNSPFGAALVCAEAAPDSPVRFAGWNEGGQPVGAPVPTPWLQVVSVSEDSAGNVWDALVPMIQLGPLAAYIPDSGLTRVNLPAGGRIEPVSSSADSRLGARLSFCLMDETHLWVQARGGHKLAGALRRNIAGMGGRWIETTNAWDPREDSVAQRTSERERHGVLFDDVEPGPGSIRNKQERRRMLRKVYGDSWWVDLDRVEDEIIAMLGTDPAQAERFFLNRKQAGEDAAIDFGLWDRQTDRGFDVPERDLVTVGVDGARFSDALAIIATHVPSGFQWPVWIAERPEHATDTYEHDMVAADGAMQDVFASYDVWRAYCDPQYIEDLVDRWQGRWGDKRVLAWHTNRPKQMAWATRAFVAAIGAGDVHHPGDPVVARHVRNARRQKLNVFDPDRRPMFTVSKDRPDSPRKIDAVAASILSWEARGDAIAAGMSTGREPLIAVLGR